MADGFLHPDVAPLDVSSGDQPVEPWAQRQLDQLEELAAIGMQIARALPPQAPVPAEDPAAGLQLTLAFDRVARAIRLTHALAARLRRDLKAGADARRVERKAEAEASRAEARVQRKAGLRRCARQAIADHEPVFEQGGLWDRLDERLEDLCDDEDLLLDRPFSTLLIEICEALGLVADFTVWRHEPWAIAEVRDRPPGSEYARFHDDMVAEGEWTEEEDGGEDIDPGILPDARAPP